MPNWCQNILKISGPEVAMHAFLGKSEDRRFSLETYYPYGTPDGEWDYDWCIQNWGTKWDVSENGSMMLAAAAGAEMPESSTYMMAKLNGTTVEGSKLLETEVTFLTAWGPPTEGISHIAKQHPELRFELIYFEAGHGFAGRLTVDSDGETSEGLDPETAAADFGFEYIF